MRNFLAFIRRFRVLLLFAFLQGIAMAMYFTFLTFPRSQYLTSASYVSGSMYEMQHNVTQYLNLRKNNSALQRENSRLRKSLPQSLSKTDHGRKLKDGFMMMNDTLHEIQYNYIPAQVINSTYTKRNNYFTINIGKDHGIKRNMGVFSSDGVVGVIQNVSEHYAVVRSCITEKVRIAVMIESSGEHGFLDWDGKNPRRGSLTGITNDSEVEKWSNVITRGSAGIFPKGIPVGKVLSSKPIEGKPLWDITILFAENYRTVQRVYVIQNLRKTEQDDLESNIPPDVVD